MGYNSSNAPARAGANDNVRRNRKVAPAASASSSEETERTEVLARLQVWRRRLQLVRLIAGQLEVIVATARAVRDATPAAPDAPLPAPEIVAEAYATATAQVFPGVALDPAALVAAGRVAMAHAGAPSHDMAARAAMLEALSGAFGPAEQPLRRLFPDL